MKWTPLLILPILLLAGCGGTDEAPAVSPATKVLEVIIQPTEQSQQATAVQVVEQAEPSQAIPPTETLAPLPTVVQPTPGPTVNPQNTPEASSLADPELAPTEGVVINGQYDKTYFRGSASAPVTIIDYSDFL